MSNLGELITIGESAGNAAHETAMKMIAGKKLSDLFTGKIKYASEISFLEGVKWVREREQKEQEGA